jgi:SAM-dependent methyltransferase/uncharacterized protein YbaR (Trm112 family)
MAASHPPIIDYEGSDYQATFWEQGARAYEDQAEAVALRRLLPSAGGDLLLEIGAGAGRNTLRYTGYARILLLDYSLTQLQQARQRLLFPATPPGTAEPLSTAGAAGERYIFVAADAYRLPFPPAQFEAVTMIRTLHHLADAPAALAQVRQVLQPGGIFILEYANKRNLKAIARYLLRRQDWNPFDRAPIEFAALNFDFHPAAVRGWLAAAGLHVERQLTVSHFRLSLLKRLVPLRLLVWLDALAQLTGGWWQFSPSVFVRARVTGSGSPSALAKQGKENGAQRPAIHFRCPDCAHFPLVEMTDGLDCPACSRHWPIHDGIYDLRVI